MSSTHALMQAPPNTDYEAATAKVIGPDAVDDARTLQGRYRVYDVSLGTAQRIIEENRKVFEARYSYQGDERVPGVCFIDELPCGCIYELPEGPAGKQGAVFQRCQEHSPVNAEAFCCEQSLSYPCACAIAQWCPEHGDQHKGRHD